MTEYYQIPVKYIHSSVPESEFPPNEINDLALAIINAGCLLEPLIVRQINFQSYELISDHRNYYAALKAKELNIHVAEMVSVFVIPDENYEGVLKQIELLSEANELLPTDSQQSLQILNAIHKLQSQTNEVLKRIEQVESNVQSTIANTTPVVTQPSIPDPELGKSLEQSLSAIVSSLAAGELEANIEIKKPGGIKSLPALTLEELKEICQKLSLVILSSSELRDLYNSLSLTALTKQALNNEIPLNFEGKKKTISDKDKLVIIQKLIEAKVKS